MRWDHIPIISFLENDIPVEVAEEGQLIYEEDGFVSVRINENKNKITMKAEFDEGEIASLVFQPEKHQL